MSLRIVAVLLLGLSLSACTSVVFQPLRPHLLDPADFGIHTEDIYFTTPDGIKLHGWWLPAEGEVRGTFLFLHGNAENISTHIGSVYWLPDFGFNVFLFDYRGYGRSEGKPTLDGVHLDIQSALEEVLSTEAAKGRPVVLFGQSLGGALAITALARSDYRECVDALVTEGAFSTYRAVAREVLGSYWLTWVFQWPLSLTIDDEYRPIADIGKLAPIPVLIMHGTEDNVISHHHAETLYRAAGQPKTLWLVPGAAHIAALKEEENRRTFIAHVNRMLEQGRKDYSAGECASADGGVAETPAPR